MATLTKLPQDESRTDVMRESAWSDLFSWILSSRQAPEEFRPFLLSQPVINNDTTSRIDTASHSISSLYVALAAQIPEVERIFWRRAEGRIRVWTVIDLPDEAVEDQISKTECELMEVLHEYDFDFSVIFRQGKPHEHINPLGAFRVFSRI